MDPPVVTFKMDYFPCFLLFIPCYGLGAFVGLGISVFIYGSGSATFLFVEIAVILAVTPLMSLLTAFLMCAVYKVKISSTGIKCFDFWGRYHTIDWAGISTISPFNFCGLKYLRIHLPQKKIRMWLPLFLIDMQRFHLLVQVYAGADNPLAVQLRRPGA